MITSLTGLPAALELTQYSRVPLAIRAGQSSSADACRSWVIGEGMMTTLRLVLVYRLAVYTCRGNVDY